MIDTYFKGFIPTKGKKSLIKFKDGELKSLEQVKDLPEYAGVLDEETVLIDLDDGDQAEKLMDIVENLQINCRVYQTTRGKHFLFKDPEHRITKCFTHCTLACGLTADIKAGIKNSYEVLKIEGSERFKEWEELPDQAMDLPKWLEPVKCNVDFLNMDAGDGRNQALFNHILPLQSAGFTMAECRETIRIINKYLLKDPLEASELEVILRDEAFQKPVYFREKTFLHNVFGDSLKRQFNIKRINGQLSVYDSGIYLGGESMVENKMIQIFPEIKSQQRMEVLKYLDKTILEDTDGEDFCNLIAFRNGIYDLKQNCMVPFDPSYIIMNRIPWNYNPSAYCEITDLTLNKISCQDPEIRSLLEEIIGYCMFRKDILQKSFILTGTGANGKSTFLKVLKILLGKNNVSVLDIAELSDRFSTEMLTGKLANIGDDISDEFLQGKQLSTFKKIVSGESIKAEQKGIRAYNFKPYCKLLFSANEIPRMRSKGFYAIKRRFVIVPFDAVFRKTDTDFDKDIEDKLKQQESMEYLIRIGLEGLKRALNNDGFTESKKTQEELEQFEKDNDPVLAWIDSIKDDDHYLIREPLSVLHRNFTVFCIENGFNQEIQSREFAKKIKQISGLSTRRITVKGKKETFFE